MILELKLPSVVTARALTAALRRGFDSRHGLRLAFARHHGLSPADVSRALNGRLDRPDVDAPLQRVAIVHGYVPHPLQPGHYRRVEAPVVPDIDPELERLRADARAEDDDDKPDSMFADLEYDAAHERFLEQLMLDEAGWRRAAELDLTPDDLAYLVSLEREDAL